MTVRRKTSSHDIVTLARPPLPLASGDPIAGGYVVVEHYGSGPLGHTYRVRGATGGEFAVKIVAHELVPTPAERNVLVSELGKLVGRAMSRVASPTAVGIENGNAFVVSPWVVGRSLRRVLGAYRDAARAVRADEVLGILEGVVEALRQLHQICPHGALYPESIQLARDGSVVLTDAGLAGAVPRARLVDHFLQYHDVVPYLSPELRGGKRCSAGSDLYALGALASELLTGDPGAAAAGIAAPMLLAGVPRAAATALAGLTALKSAQRASSLPSLLDQLAKAVGKRTMPSSAMLPQQRQRTDVIEASNIEVPKTRRGATRE